MKYGKKIFLSIFWVMLGAALVVLACFELIDTFWSGMGGGLICLGIIRIVQYVKYRKNPEYREKMEIERNDERNKFIGGRAWAWAGYFFVLINGVGSIVFKIVGNDLLSQYCGYSVCAILILYWVSFAILRKKY